MDLSIREALETCNNLQSPLTEYYEMSRNNECQRSDEFANIIVSLNDEYQNSEGPQNSLSPNNSEYQKSHELKNLLISWDCEQLFDLFTSKLENKLINLTKLFKIEIFSFSGQQIDIEILTMWKDHHFNKFLSNVPHGIQIKFEHHLIKWRENINKPLEYNLTQNKNAETESLNKNDAPIISTIAQPPCSSITEISNSNSNNISEILNNSSTGQMLKLYYEINNHFKETQRNMLITILAQHYFDKNINITLATSYQIEKEIVRLFPNENESFYRCGKRGKLYNKISNMKVSRKSLKNLIADKSIPVNNDTDESTEMNFGMYLQ